MKDIYMLPKHLMLLTASAFALSACLGSGSSTPASSGQFGPVETLPPVDATEDMPTEGTATYSGNVNATVSAENEDPDTAGGTMSMTANFTPMGGTVTAGRVTLNGISGALEQGDDVAIIGSGFSGMQLLGTLTETLDGDEGTATSGGANVATASGEFQGTDADQVEITFGGTMLGDEDEDDILDVSGGGVLIKPAP